MCSVDVVKTQGMESPEADVPVSSGSNIRAYVVANIDKAIANGWVVVYYQPVFRTVSNRICGFEALARWIDPQRGIIGPVDFIGALEDARLIHKFDSFVINQVCVDLRRGIDSGLTVVPVSFNLSRLDFDLCDILQVIEDAVHSNGLSRNLVNVEITESVFGAEPEFMAKVISRIRSLGYQVWMDDFGSAYSSLNVLKDFDFDELKIDMGFLKSFGRKSRAIVASIVAMAKRLGIQTLAEGVETQEHADFLREIGCEKQQGYLYGKPMPYNQENYLRIGREIGIEEERERRYYRMIGSVNTLSLSEQDFISGDVTEDYVTSMPLAFVEYDGECDAFSVLDCNEPFIRALENVGIPDVETAEQLINDTRRSPARNTRNLVRHIQENKFAKHDYVTNGIACVMRAKHLATHDARTTILITMESAEMTSESHRRERMGGALEALYSIYEHVDLIHLDESYSEPVFSHASFESVYEQPSVSEAVREFAKHEVYPDDRERYLEFLDFDTLGERLDASRQNYITSFFRLRDHGGNYAWKIVMLIRVGGHADNTVLICIRSTSWENDALLQVAYSQEAEEGEWGLASADADLRTCDMSMNEKSLWRALIGDPGVGVFWKDAERRFVGCNQAFLDYYEFGSVDAILGKTDEDMHWHVNPEPFMNDELHVINDGHATNGVLGQCISHGKLRDIIASKRPVYRNGRIVGLVGHFRDVTDLIAQSETGEFVTDTDSVTGLLNYSGLDNATNRYISAYRRLGIDFGSLNIEVSNTRMLYDKHGPDFGDRVLQVVGGIICEALGGQYVIAAPNLGRFTMLRQEASLANLESVGDGIIAKIMAVPNVDGIPCTLYAHYAVALFSETEDFEKHKRLLRTRLYETNRKHAG